MAEKARKSAARPASAGGSSKAGGTKKPAPRKPAQKSDSQKSEAGPRLLSGGNPQIPMGYGDEPVQAYIEAMPEWKRDVGRRLDEVITRTLPKVRKAVKWNSPFYGLDETGWLISYHCFAKYVKVTFLNGASLDPLPPGPSKDENTRYLDIYEDDEFDERQFARWVKQASKSPGWITTDLQPG